MLSLQKSPLLNLKIQTKRKLPTYDRGIVQLALSATQLWIQNVKFVRHLETLHKLHPLLKKLAKNGNVQLAPFWMLHQTKCAWSAAQEGQKYSHQHRPLRKKKHRNSQPSLIKKKTKKEKLPKQKQPLQKRTKTRLRLQRLLLRMTRLLLLLFSKMWRRRRRNLSWLMSKDKIWKRCRLYQSQIQRQDTIGI